MSTCYYQKIQPSSFGFFLLSLFAMLVSLFAKSVSLFALYYSYSGCCQKKVIFNVCSFCCLFLPPSHFENCWEQNPKVTGCHFSGYSIKFTNLWLLFNPLPAYRYRPPLPNGREDDRPSSFPQARQWSHSPLTSAS